MKVGIVGCGKIATTAHLPALSTISEAEVVSVSDLNENRALKVAKRFGVAHHFKDYKEMLKDETIDIVDICTPAKTHADIAVDAAASGKNILVEKPISSTIPDALRMIDAAKSNGVKLCVVQNFRYFPAMQQMKRTILTGKVGDVVSIDGVCHQHFPLKWSPRTWWFDEGGVIFDVGVHMIDAVLWLFGRDPESVYAVGGDYLEGMNCINQACVVIEFARNRAAMCNFSWLTGRTIFGINVHGTGGHLFSDMCFNHYTEVHGTPTPLDDARGFISKMSTFGRDVSSGKFFLSSMAYHKPLIEDFIGRIKSKKPEPVTGREALLSLAIAESILQSIKKRDKVHIKSLLSENQF
jgi:predicted dehydrogenase